MDQGIQIFGKTFATMNCHLLLHISRQVQTFGPLWVNWAFPLESALGFFGRRIHSNRKFSIAYVRSFQISKALGDYREPNRGNSPNLSHSSLNSSNRVIKRFTISRQFRASLMVRPWNPKQSRDDSAIMYGGQGNSPEIGKILAILPSDSNEKVCFLVKNFETNISPSVTTGLLLPDHFSLVSQTEKLQMIFPSQVHSKVILFPFQNNFFKIDLPISEHEK